MQQCNEERQSQPMVVSITSRVGCGTGFFVRENLIATNIHCVAGATSVSAKLLHSNIEYNVEGVVAFDDKNDLVILEMSGIGTPFPIGNSDMIKKGEIVQAVGCIGGKYVTTEGEVHCFLNNEQWLQTTARTIEGYSGGPLLNSKGLVVGINVITRGDISNAVSSNILKELIVQTRTIESLDQWQKREKICAYDYVVQSKSKIKGKDYANAIVDLDKAIQLNPHIINNYYNRGTLNIRLAQLQSEQGNFIEAQEHRKSAIVDFTRAINLCPEFVSAYNNRADTKRHFAKFEADSGNLEASQSLYQDAMNDIKIAIKKCPNNPIEKGTDIALCHHTRGEIKESMGDLAGAKNDFEKAMTNSEYTNDSTISEDLKRVKEKLKQQE